MKKAIDIVLLPPEEIMDLAIGLNKPWVKGIDDEIALDKKTCLPHITLAMGLIEPDQIATVEKAMRGIAQQFSPLSLKIIAANTLNLEKIRCGNFRKCGSCGHWNRFEVEKVFLNPGSPEPKVRILIPSYLPLKTEECEKCGQLIEPRRLEAFPSAGSCMACKRKAAGR